MSELIFPSGITWEQNYLTGGDFMPENLSAIYNNGWAYCKNGVIDNCSDTSNSTSFKEIFTYCSLLCMGPMIDTSNATNTQYMFNSCTRLYTIPTYNFENVTDATYMFQNCSGLVKLPDLNLKKITTVQYMFSSCNNLCSIGVIDCDSVTGISSMFGYSSNSAIATIGGFRNLGAKSSLSGTTSSFMENMPNLTRQSLLNVLNLLYDRASAGYSVVTIKLHANHHAILTDEDKAIATNKGWALS